MKKWILFTVLVLFSIGWNGFLLASIVRCKCEDSWIVATRFNDVATTGMLYLLIISVLAVLKKEKTAVIILCFLLLLANPFVVAFITNHWMIPNGTDPEVWIRWNWKTLLWD